MGQGRFAEQCKAARAKLGAEWRFTPANGPTSPWCSIARFDRRLPRQGWKIHVSAYAWSAGPILEAVLEVILRHRAAIKVLETESYLLAINGGDAGSAQVGKFITIYPADVPAALAVARDLVGATRGRPGPPVVTDMRLDPAAPVYGRYGVFDASMMQTPLGALYSAMTAPDGALVPDRRDPVYVQPEWAPCPFEGEAARPHELDLGPDIQLIAGLYQSGRSTVQLALDVERLRACVVKRYLGAPEPLSSGATARMQREAEILRVLDGCEGVTASLIRAIAGSQDAPDAALVMTDLAGERLDRLANRTYGRGDPLPPERVRRIARRLAHAVAKLHLVGVVHGDLKSANVLLDEGDQVRLVDFDNAVSLASPGPPAPAFTRGYAPSQAPRVLSEADDVYALGAVIYLLATGSEPSRAPAPENLLARPVEMLNPSTDEAVATAIAACLAPDPSRRLSAQEAAQVLASTVRRRPRPPPNGIPAQRALDCAWRFGDRLCEEAHKVEREPGRAWTSRHAIGKGRVLRDLNTGVAGTVLALAEIVQAFDEPRHKSVLQAGCEWLAQSRPFAGGPLPGLCVGESGVALALLRTGQVLNDAQLIGLGLQRIRRIAPDDIPSPDFFHGAAGHLLARIIAWDQTGESGDRQAVLATARALAARRTSMDGWCWWDVPAQFEDIARAPSLGYAHGAAGIADILLDAYALFPEPDLAAAIEGSLAWLGAHELPAPSGAARWPATPHAPAHAPFWCHGASGVGVVFNRAAKMGLAPRAAETAARAAHAARQLGRWSGASICHGLGGMIELLLDLGASAENDEVGGLNELVHLLEAFAVEDELGLTWITEAPRIVTPDYLVGYAGIAVLMLRLGEPGRPRQLSRAGFRYGLSPTQIAAGAAAHA